MEVHNNILFTVVIPCLNEESNIFPLLSRIEQSCQNLGSYEVLFVDDGSTDKTLEKIKMIEGSVAIINYISFTRSFGHQNAIFAGIKHSSGQCVITMDADLQHPPEIIPRLIEKWKEGYLVVATKRNDNENINPFKKLTSYLFYRCINLLSNTKLVDGAADFRLVDQKVVQELKLFPERDIFWRGIFNWIGHDMTFIEYTAESRQSGATKYTPLKMIRFAISGITSFSTKPLYAAIYIGFVLMGFAFLYFLYILYIYFITGKAVEGWASTISSILFVGGIQVSILGVIGVYIAKMFEEIKKRPHYIISETSK